MYKFYLKYNSKKNEIPEPIGWDGLELTLKRNEKSHGIDVEYSDLSLQFYGEKAIGILEDAYNNDIDNLITFICENNGIEEYRGQLDFEAYNKVYEDGYCYIEVKVADIGIQVLFNNRIDQKVDLDSLKSFDSETDNLTQYPMLKHEIELPSRGMMLVSQLSNTSAERQYVNTDDSMGTYRSFLFQPQLDIVINELDTIYSVPATITSSFSNINNNIFFKFSEENNLTYKPIELSVIFNLNYRQIGSFIPEPFDKIQFTIYKNDSNTVIYDYTIYDGNPIMEYDIKTGLIKIIVDMNKNDVLFFSFKIHFPEEKTEYRSCNYTIREAKIEMKSLTTFPSTNANMSLLHETMSRIAESITNKQITVKSDYYGRKDSNINPTNTNGIGSFKALATGLRVRNIPLRDAAGNDMENSDTLFTLSFSDVIKSLTAIDNIGFGFVTENGIQYLHVESLEWFYKIGKPIFEIHNPNKIERGIDSNRLYSIFKCGYKKYETENFNGLDAFHTEREYRTRLKLKNNAMEQKSDFIADGYAIEYTRRESINTTSDWRYDNDVFIFCLKKTHAFQGPDSYVIDLGASETGNTMISPDTVYNMRISPVRMAKKWLNRLSSLGFGKKEDIIFTSGTGNLQAKGRARIKVPIDILPPLIPDEYADKDTELYVENQNFKNNSLILLPELIKVPEYPVTVNEYKTIKENPYGIITVDDTPCYISEIKYKKQKNTASFVLIPKKV